MIRIHMVMLAILAICTVALAQESEIEAARHRIQDLLAEAERIEHEAAERVRNLRQEAERIEARLRGAERRHDERPDRARTEREVAHEQLEVMRLAFHAFREAERRDAAEMLEHAIHARELALEGRRDDEAMHIRETAPSRAEQAELLADAARLWREFGNEERARAVAGLAEQLRPRERPRPARERNDREHAMHELEIMRLAMTALREGERRDALELLERAIHARELALEGRAEAAEHARRDAPGTGQQAEILGLASRLWAEFGHEEKARTVGRLAEELAGRSRAERERRTDVPEHADHAERIELLTHRLEEMAEVMERMQGAMEEMHAELRRLRRRD